MARPRTILGMLLYLTSLHARRRPLAAIAIVSACAGVFWWRRHSAEPSVRADGIQSAVLRDGFLLAHGPRDSRRVLEIDARGNRRKDIELGRSGDVRVVGTAAGATAAWQDGKQVRLARLGDGREVGAWGKSVRHLCDGVASNDVRFAVGWLEADETVWIVHGPSSKDLADAEGPSLASARPAHIDWCGVASAEDNVALLWRDRDHLSMGMCTAKRCTSLPAGFRLDPKLPIIGFGCLRNACLVATRDGANVAQLALLTETSKTKWKRPLDAAISPITILGIGDRSLVAGYATANGAEIVRVGLDGSIASIWRDPAATTSPTLAWSAGRLLIAYQRGDELVHEVVPLAP